MMTANEAAAALIARVPGATAARWNDMGDGVGVNLTVESFKTLSGFISKTASEAQIQAEADRLNAAIATMGKPKQRQGA
jgi:hypothetical protein